MSKEKIKNALNRYYKAFDYDEGTLAYKRGGQMGFEKKHKWGGPNGTTWMSEIDQTPVNEFYTYDANGQISGYGTDYYTWQYWNQHPDEYLKMQGADSNTIANLKSTNPSNNPAGAQGSDFLGGMSKDEFTKGLTQAGTTLKNFGKSDPTLGKNVNMSTPWSAIAGTAGSLTVDLQRAIDSYIRSKDKHVYNPMHSAGLYKKGGNKFEGGGFSSNPMDIGNSFLKIASNAVNQGSLTTDYDTFEDALERYENNQINALNNISDNDALMMAYANHGALSPDDIRARDFRDKTVLGDITDGLASSFEGFNATGNWIGAVVGGVASNVGSIVGRVRAAKAARKAQEATAVANKDWDSRYFHAVQDVDRMNDTRRLIGFYNNPFDYAYGGEMRTHGADFNNGLTFINEGGTHEENPYEGVPSGVDEEGVPNLVEEGEVIWNNEYVFSNRIKVPKHLAKKYKLGGDLTFADAIKKVTKESLTRPNDPISNETNKAIVNEFMDEQEAIREREQQNAARQLQRAYDEDFMEQMDVLSVPPQEAPENTQGIQLPQQDFSPEVPLEGMPAGFADGGPKRRVQKILRNQAEKLLEDSGVMSKKEIRQQKLRRLQSQIEEILGPPSPQELINLPERIDSIVGNNNTTSEPIFPDIFDGNTGSSKKNRFDKGSKKNSGYKPGLTGTPVEGLEDVYDTGNGVYYDAKTGQYYANIDTIRYLRGLPPISMDEEITAATIIDDRKKKEPESEAKVEVSGGNGAAKRTFKSDIKFTPKGAKDIKTLNATDRDDIIPYEYRPTWQRMAPVYGAGAMALYGMANRPDYSNADAIIEAARLAGVPVNIPIQTIGDYMTYKPFDERYLVNMANQNRAAAARGIANTSNGNRAMDLLGNMVLAHSTQQELGEIARQAYLANQQQRSAAAEFNRGTNVQNMSAINSRNLAQAQLNSQRQATALSGLERGYASRQGIKDAWDAATMQSLNSMLASLGAIGKENEEYNMMTSMAEHGYFPYYYGNNGVMQFAPASQQANQPVVLWQPDPNWKVNYQWKLSSKGGVKKNKKRRF